MKHMHFDWFDYTHHKYAQCKQKGFSLVFIMIGVLVALVIFSVPWPGYRSKEVCTESDPPVCRAKGWYLKMPLYQQLFFAQQTTQQSILPTPLPSITSVREGDPTANWKTYKNTEYRYSLKYPPDWVVTEFPKDLLKESTTLGEVKINSKKDNDTPNVKISVLKVNTYTKGGGERFILNNVPAERGINEIPTGVFHNTIVATKGGFDYRIELEYATSDKEQFTKIYDQILSTFKFLD